MNQTVEIRTYNLKPGSRERFARIARERSHAHARALGHRRGPPRAFGA